MAHTIGKVEGATQDLVKVRRALLSVSDKTGLVELATFLHAQGVELPIFAAPPVQADVSVRTSRMRGNFRGMNSSRYREIACELAPKLPAFVGDFAGH